MEVTPQQFYIEYPIYTEVYLQRLEDVPYYTDPKNVAEFDGYNPIHKIETTYYIYSGATVLNIRQIMTVAFRCKRTNADFYFFLRYNSETMTLMKVGQFPSVADFHISQVKQYDKLLAKEKLKEFTRAIGLAANGVGIGSFVYLRRIFEDLIFEAYKEHQEMEGDIKGFTTLNMSDKINSLRHNLPEFLVENKSMYSILSKGIHEMEEQECLTYFDAVKVGIELILDEKLEQFKKKKKVEQASFRIQAITNQLKSSPTSK